MVNSKNNEVELYKYIGVRIRHFRRIHKLTQAQLADLLNISAQQVQKYENAIDKIKISKLLQLCDILSLSIRQFLPISASYYSGGYLNDYAEYNNFIAKPYGAENNKIMEFDKELDRLIYNFSNIKKDELRKHLINSANIYANL